ncbi:MAG: hypothetical protein MPJ50_19260 [Pirellulales bacterium]|nr:hypothetical protein [Pirellulales bacterium]
MRYLIGVDEAGYGPNLGPLVIAATLWELDACQIPPSTHPDLYEALGDCVRAAGKASTDDARVQIADSKQVYKAGKGLDQLELGVLSALRSLGFHPHSWQELCQTLAAGWLDEADLPNWYAAHVCKLPSAASEEAVELAAATFCNAFQKSGVRLKRVRARMIFPLDFNERIRQRGTKGLLLSEASLQLVADLLDEIERKSSMSTHASGASGEELYAGGSTVRPAPFVVASAEQSAQAVVQSQALPTQNHLLNAPMSSTSSEGETLVFLDKHGGRNKYAGLLQHVIPDGFPIIESEGPRLSSYRCQSGKRQIRFQFEVGGERHLPVALASMTAKYLREKVMHAFNAFWRAEIPSLKPTAGYPVDARRFLAEIKEKMCSLEISASQIWRDR